MLRLSTYLWTSPNTSIGVGITVLTLATGGRCRLVEGVVETSGGAADWILKHLTPIEAAAMTLGHVVIARDALTHDRTRRHERVHVRQYERLGPFFIPAYVAASAIIWVYKIRTGRGDPYMDNPFEQEAYAVEAETEF